MSHLSWNRKYHPHPTKHFGMVQSQSVCPQCNGEGKIIKNKCKACAGEGIVYGEEVVEVKIPAGVAEGMQLSVNGKEMRANITVFPVIYLLS